MSTINIYYSPGQLSDLLMSEVETGDPAQLHNACIALCAICEKLSARIVALEEAANDLYPNPYILSGNELAEAEAKAKAK